MQSGVLRGGVKGLSDGRNYYSFEGIPFAQPPVGDLRFRDPIPFNKWTGILDATKQSHSCIEFELNQVDFDVHGSEDCLYLNVYTTQDPRYIQERLPVMVWFYGGYFREGNSSLYSPVLLLRENVIVVTLNYRVGVYGFLSTSDLSSPGNYGLKDQLIALKWVQANIVKFGGDPGKVTIFGESAGSASVGFHLLSNQAKGLFHGAILQSGTPLCNWALDRNPRQVAFDLGNALGFNTKNSTSLVKFLRQADLSKSDQVIKTLYTVNFLESFFYGGPFGPVIEPNYDGAFITKDSLRALKTGDFARVPVIIGVNSQEGKLLTSVIEAAKPFFFLFDVSPSSLVRDTMNVKSYKDRRYIGTKIAQYYFKSKGFIAGTDEEFTKFLSDDMFLRPIVKTTVLMSKFIPVYHYVYDYEGSLGRWWLKFKAEYRPDIKGVAHATDILYLWNLTIAPTTFKNKEERLVSERLTRLWTNFAKFGNPTPCEEDLLQNVQWPKVSGKSLQHLYIGTNLKVSSNFQKESVDFWEHLYKCFSKEPYQIY